MKVRIGIVALALAFLAPAQVHAHRAWLAPSATVLSGSGVFVTFDAAISNDLFVPEFYPLELDGLVVTAPDGSTVKAENASTGKYRSVFDVSLKVPGTYRVTIDSNELFATYKLNGEQKRWRGPVGALAQIPAAATDLELTDFQSRIETFVTAGKPDEQALKPRGKGLELVPLTHPTDLTAGGESTFKLLIDGEPASGVKAEVVRGGMRYRGQPGEISVTTGGDGLFKVKWPDAEMYLLEASFTDNKPAYKDAKARHATYSATFEVLPE